jgi:hypothetical protein
LVRSQTDSDSEGTYPELHLTLFRGDGFLLYSLYTTIIQDMGNPNPRPENLKPIPRHDDTTDPLAASALMARVPIPIDAAVRSLPNRTAWLRRVITEAAQRELMKDGSEAARE